MKNMAIVKNKLEDGKKQVIKEQIKVLAYVLSAVIAFTQPCTVLAAEMENDIESETELNTKSETESKEEPENETEAESKEDSETESETDSDEVQYITGFEKISEEESYLSCMYKPSLEELLEVLPTTLQVQLNDDEDAELEVTWECEEDFDNSDELVFVFSPKWDETKYEIEESVQDTIEIPTFTIEVPAGIIPDLEAAQEALQDISQEKSILALVYLCDKYDVKKSASYESETLAAVTCGQSVLITGVDVDENDTIWFQVIFYQNETEYSGYIEKSYLATSDENLTQWEETYINREAMPMTMALETTDGYPDVEQFPASYQNSLYTIKEAHPNWIFVKMETGLDWNTVIQKELGDKSLVHYSSPGSWQNGYYGQGWSYASAGILKYFMDPRNFLTESGIFQFEQLTYNDSYHTTEAVQEIIKNSFMASDIPGEGQTYSQAFRNIGQRYGVSPFHLASRVLQEQGAKGTSPLISGTYSGYQGYYNYFNVGASGTTDQQVIVSGLKTAVANGWNTRYKSLEGGASTIGVKYIRRGQDTLYLEKFNVSNGQYANFTHQYMQNIEAPSSEAKNVRKAYVNAGALGSNFVFKIPVYKNMPSSACSKPDTTDSLTLNKTSVSGLEVNKTTKIIPYVNGSKLDNLNDITFTSNNPSIASVDNQGKVTAIAPGTTMINCSRQGTITVGCTVTVVKATPSVTTPVLSPITYKEGLKLSDIALPDGWAWEKGNTTITAGTSAHSAVYTPSDTGKYNKVTKEISFTVTKAVPNCQVPENLSMQSGSKLSSVALPSGFVWESDVNTDISEPGEYTFYVSYNPDKNSYYTVEHIPIIIQVTGSNDKDDDVTSSNSTGSGSSGGDSTGGTSGSGAGSTGGSSGGSTTTSGSSTGTSSGSTDSSGGNTDTDEDGDVGGSTSKPVTSSGSSTTISSGSSTTTSGGSTNTGSGNVNKPVTSSGSSTTISSGSSTTTSGSSTGTGSGSTDISGGNTDTDENGDIGGGTNKPVTSSGSSTTISSGSTNTGSGNTNKPVTSSGSSTTISSGSTNTGSGNTNKPVTSSGSSTTISSGSSTTTSGGSTGTGSGNTNKPVTSSGSTNTGSGSTSKPVTSSGSSTTISSGSSTTTSSGSTSKPVTSSGSSINTSTNPPSSNSNTGSTNNNTANNNASSTNNNTANNNAGNTNSNTVNNNASSTNNNTANNNASDTNSNAANNNTGNTNNNAANNNTGNVNNNVAANNAEITNSNAAANTNNAASQNSSLSNDNKTNSTVDNNTNAEAVNSEETNSEEANSNTVLNNEDFQVIEDAEAEETMAAVKPSVTIEMDDTTILTVEKLEMAKMQNFVLTLDMGNQAKWNIDAATVDLDAFTALDMGIVFGIDKIPLELIDALAGGSEYLQFSLAHDGAFGFTCVLSVILNPKDCGRYANLFYYNPETKELEFICESIIDAQGNAAFQMNHASDYVIIISDQSMSGLLESDGENHMIKWIVLGTFIFMLLVVVGYGFFFYWKKKQEDIDEEEDDSEENDSEEDNSEEDDSEENDDEEDDSEENDSEENDSDESAEEAETIEKAESETELETVSLEESAEDDWIEDDDWNESQASASTETTTEIEKPKEKLSEDNTEDDWIDDDEWDVGNDWMDDAEWEAKNQKEQGKS